MGFRFGILVVCWWVICLGCRVWWSWVGLGLVFCGVVCSFWDLSIPSGFRGVCFVVFAYVFWLCVANVRSFVLGLGCSRVLFWLVSVCLLVVYWFGGFALGLMS